MIKFFEITGGDRIGERRRASTGKGKFYEIVTGDERCRGLMVLCDWIGIFCDEEVNPGM